MSREQSQEASQPATHISTSAVVPEEREESLKTSIELSQTRNSNEQSEQGVSDLDGVASAPNIDGWDSDPDNPRNWPLTKKWVAVCIVSMYTFLPPLSSSMLAPGLPEIALEYHIKNPTMVAMVLSIFLLSYALGPLVMAPLSEIYGRTWVLHICNILTMAFNLGCAFAPTTGALITFRFLTGFSGAAPVTIGGGSVSDLFSERERASAMALYTLGPLVGPVAGPIAGGFITQSIGVKWVFIVIAATAGLASLIAIPLLRETYAPTIQIKKLRKRSSDPEKAMQLQKLLEGNKKWWQVLGENLVRPVVLLTQSLICFILSLYMAFIYGIFYLMFTTFPDLFSKTYGFKPGVGGLVYLGLGTGFFFSSIFSVKAGDKIYQRLADKNGGKGTPEMRIPALFIGSFFVPAGLFWYGWSAQAKLHWIMPIIGTGIFSFGLLTCFLPITLYLVDAFKYAASAVAAASVFRCLVAFIFPLFGQQMYDALGLGGGNSLLAGLAIILGIPFPAWLYYKGEALRARNPLTR